MGIRNDRYKLIFFYGDRLGMTGSDDCVSTPSWEFYDLRTDPHENRNQYGNPAYAEVIGAMKREMLELRRQYKDTDEGCGTHAGDHGDPLRPRKRKTLTFRIKKQNRT